MDLLAHLIHYFVIVLRSFFIIPPCYIFHSIFCLCYHISFHALSDDFSHFNAWRTVISPFNSQLMDIGLDILSWEGHLIKESSCKSMFKTVSISLCILSEAHLLIFRACVGKKKKERRKKKKEKKKKRKIGTYMYVCMYTMSFSIECIY